MYIVSDIILCNCRGLVMGCRWRWWWRWRQISATSRRTSRFERNNTTFVSFLSIPMSSQNIIHFNLTSFGNYGSRTHEGCRDCRDRQAHHSARPPPSEATRSHPPLLQNIYVEKGNKCGTGSRSAVLSMGLTWQYIYSSGEIHSAYHKSKKKQRVINSRRLTMTSPPLPPSEP